jgi:hypothetical protein
MNERIKELSLQAMSLVMNGKDPDGDVKRMYIPNCFADKFAELVRADEREACIDIIETYRIPVGNSASGELACEWTYATLHEIRDDIRARGEK